MLETRHEIGTRGVAKIIIPATSTTDTDKANQKRLIILGTSLKKLDLSTSFLVAAQVMLYENRWANIAWERWMLIPPKKKKLNKISNQMICHNLN